ncbi:protein NRT1/ PTR FAMILY 5.4-like [Prunus yedoensis var. nudiflora]|uniref:Protein NRT1/ PTR FAMILY 5.4-like n=1 Tax=Prunus yedoensis var. nudiflora TaxID=2094558 RepID=A0A314ZMI3_PRUYE|nr:protein NRT1/ PTR FAMILY 5.4-like [Prunus yedoensis var. nudiflora]
MDTSGSAPPLRIQNDHEDREQNLISQEEPSSSRGGWGAAIFIIFVEVAERFAYYGMAGNLITYLTNELHEPIPMAAKNVNTWVGVSSLLPILGAFIADAFLGRFNTILVSSIIYLLAMVLLTITVSVIPLHYQKAMFFVALYMLSVGLAGHKPCVQTFAADQFREDSPEEKKAKSSFFNWWYLGITIGASAAILVVIYVQDNVGWAAGFGILTGAIAVALAVFLFGYKKYRKQGPLGSPFTTVAQVFVAAARKRHINGTSAGFGVYSRDDKDQHETRRLLAQTSQLRCLDKAIIIDHLDASSKNRNPWRLCSLNQVEQTFFTKQGSTMVRSIGPNFKLPQASLQIFLGLTIAVAIPIYDRVFVPTARKFTGHSSGITILQRIGIGLFLSIISMMVAALVEAKRVGIVRDHNLLDNPKAIVPMRVVVVNSTVHEFFYDQTPEAMRSMGAAAYLSVVGVGNFICTAIITLVQAISSKSGEKWLTDNLNRAHLDYFYWLIAALSTLNLCVYVWIAKGFVYKKLEAEETSKEKELA